MSGTMTVGAFEVAAAILASLGGAGLIVVGLSSWLGKVWANRLMEADKAAYATELAELRASLEKVNQSELSALKTDLDVFAKKYLQQEDDKLRIYRAATDIVADLIADMHLYRRNLLDEATRAVKADAFDRQRMKAYGYMAMLAPQPVMDKYDELIDYLMTAAADEIEDSWPEIRSRALGLINAIRIDIGIDTNPIDYKGDR